MINVCKAEGVVRGTLLNMRCKSRARVVLPLDEGPDIPMISAFGASCVFGGDMAGLQLQDGCQSGDMRGGGAYLLSLI